MLTVNILINDPISLYGRRIMEKDDVSEEFRKLEFEDSFLSSAIITQTYLSIP